MIYVLALLPIIAAATNTTMFDDEWAREQYRFSLQRIRASIAPKPEAFPGTIMASPTIIKPNPDYYYHWVRDSALTMDCLAEVMEKSADASEQKSYYGLVDTFNRLTAKLQSLPIPDKFKNDKNYDQTQWIGEPKYEMNATPFVGDWGRPQNDGPASRAFATMRFVKHMLKHSDGGAAFWNTTSKTPLVVDLDYTAEYWKKPSFEVWEEVKGSHFYTYMVQRRAMIDGAEVAKKFGDKKLSLRYKKVAKRIEAEIEKFWSPARQYITVTRNRVDGVAYKDSLLDTQVVLAALHASKNDGFYTPESDKIHATWYRLFKAFSRLYKDNINHKDMAPAIGRYPEDQYDGYVSKPDGGNGWMLLTAGMAECLYRTREAWQHQKEFTVTTRNAALLRFVSKQKMTLGETVKAGSSKFDLTMKGLVETGDRFMQRVKFHTEGWHMSEQWNRDTGKQQGAEDLTWSYVAFVTAVNARERALQQ